jgi:GT2 family glycosyltransferase
MSTEPRVAIVVLNYNGKKCLQETLSSLDALEYSNKDIIVLDNASDDESFPLAKQAFPHYQYRALPKNGGFAYGMNAGMRLALERGAEFVWLFNYDALAEGSSLAKLVESAKILGERSILSPIILQNNTVWFEGGRINYLRMRVEHLKRRDSSENKPFKTTFLTGCALFLPRIAMEEVGFLDEDFFLYYEDADYSVRALAKGFDLFVIPQATVWHSEESVHNPHKTYYLVYSGLLFFSKHKKALFSFYQAIYGILRRQKNRWDLLCHKPLAREVYRAYSEFYAKKPSIFFNNLRKL